MDVYCIFKLVLCILYWLEFCIAYQSQLDDHKLCGAKNPLETVRDFIKGKDPIELNCEHGQGQNSAIVITQTWNSTNFPRMKSSCTFKIKTKKRCGIYIVISKLKFRKNPITHKCIDYIEINNNRTCERFGADGTRTQLLFNDIEREIRITVSVDRKIEIVEPLELSISATAHYQCTGNKEDFQCDVNNRYSCISRDFVNDGIRNCLPPCRDETDCSLESVSVEAVDASNIALSAITSLIFTTVAVITCLWICWKYRDCVNLNRQNNQTNEQRQNENTQSADVPQTDRRIVNTEMHRSPSPKDDLPPSYESLFPER